MMDSIHPESEAEYEERRQELIADAKEHKRDLDDSQREILDEIQSEHGGEEIETTVQITKSHTATVRTRLDGSLIDRLSEIEDMVSSEGRTLQDVKGTMRKTAELLDSMVVEEEYDATLFYQAYQQGGPDALGVIIERVLTAISDENKRRMNAADGFRTDG